MDSVVNQLFTERFRPTKMEQLIAPERVKKQLEKGLIQNVLLFGQPGTGKTSTLFILAQGHPQLYINASSERGIETMRETIPNFCSSISLMDGHENLKCVILDECLYEEEEVRIGTTDNHQNFKLKDLEKGKIYECPSMNLKTGNLENDTCEIISEKKEEMYEVELEDGKKIIVTSNHPFMILNNGDNIKDKSIDDSLNTMDRVIVF